MKLESPFGYNERFMEERLLPLAKEVIRNKWGGPEVRTLLREHQQDFRDRLGLPLISASNGPLPTEYVEALAPFLALSTIEGLRAIGAYCLHDVDGDQSPRMLGTLEEAVFQEIVDAQGIPA